MDFKTFCFYTCQSSRQARGADKPSRQSDCSFRKRNEDEPEREYYDKDIDAPLAFASSKDAFFDYKRNGRSFYDKDINAPLAFNFFDRKKGQ